MSGISENVSKNKMQELNDLFMLVKKERQNVIKSDIFINTVLEAATPAYGVNESLGIKIKDIILREELMNDLKMNDESWSHTKMSLLDLDDFNNIELKTDEQQDLKIALEQRIKEKNDSFLNDLNELSDAHANSLDDILKTVKFNADTEKAHLITWQNKLVEQQQKHYESLEKFGQTLQAFLDLKTKRAPKVVDQKTLEMHLETEKSALRRRLMELQIHVSIFKELPITLDAYRQAITILKNQQDECRKEIEILREEIENYKTMAKNEDFQEILKKYKEYKKSFDNKLYIYNELLKNKI